MSIRRRAHLVATVCALAFAPGLAAAETLADAVALAYQTNPTLQAQRAQLRALDENYVQARQGFRPQADVQGQAAYQNTQVRSTAFNTGGVEDSNSVTGRLSASQPLYTAGRTTNTVRAAEADILAARESLRQIEAQVLFSTIQAYSDVRRDFQSLRIRETNVSVLRRQLEESQARFEVGEITRTDVAQSEARLANAQALLATAQAQLAISRSSYAAVVGQNPGDLEPEPELPNVPPTVDAAFDAAQLESPVVRQAEFTEAASRARVAAARSDLGPTVSLSGTYSLAGPIAPFGQDQFPRTITAGVTVTQPLYSGGVRRSRIRQTLERNNADLIGIESARRDVLRQVSASYQQVLAARANIASNEEQVRANRVAAEGVREEAAVGLRTTIEVLNAEQELRNAELLLVNARRDQYVATANLLAAVGRLEAANLIPGVDVYDPRENFGEIRGAGALPWEPLVEKLDAIASPDPAEAPGAIRATRGVTIEEPGTVQSETISTAN